MTQGVSATGCGFWVRHSDTCAIFKKGAVILAIAIGAIALVTGVLGQLAFQGVHLGAFNAIATQYLTTTRIFALLFGGASLLAMGIVTLSLMIYQNRNKELKKEELDSILAQEQVHTSIDSISQKLELRQYWPYNFEASESRRIYAYTLIIRDPAGVITVRAFTAWIYLRMHIHKLAQENYTNGKKAEYSPFTISNEFGNTKLQAEQLIATLREGEYNLLDAPLPNPRLFALLICTSDEKRIHYFKNAEARVEKLSHYKRQRSYFLKDHVEYAKESAFRSLGFKLIAGEYCQYPGVIEGTPVTFVSYCVESDVKTAYFLDPDAAESFRVSEIPNYTGHISDEQRRKALLKTPKKKGGLVRYSSLSTNLSNEFRTELRDIQLREGEFSIRQAIEETFVLISRKKKSSENTILYIERTQLDEKIAELKDKGFISHDAVKTVFDTCVEKNLLKFELIATNEYWQTKCTIEGKKVYLLIYCDEQNELQHLYFFKKSELDNFVKDTSFSPGTFEPSQMKGLSQAIASNFAQLLSQLDPGHYFSEPLGNDEKKCFWILVKHQDESHLSHFFKKEESLKLYIASLPAEYQKHE